MASATSRLVIFGRSSCRSAVISVTMFVSVLNPAPGFVTSFATIRSRFFAFSFSSAWRITWSVSAAKPTMVCFAFFMAPTAFAMSGFSSSVITIGSPAFFLIFVFAGAAAR